MSEPTQKDEIESVLADLSVQRVSEQTPKLFDHYLGFELIDKNEEGTRAAGLLGFVIGKAIAYIPVLFLNGRIRGTEMLYLKDSDRFVSNTKQWVDFLVNRNPEAVGSPGNHANRGQVGLAQLQVFRDPQVGPGSKTAEFLSARSGGQKRAALTETYGTGSGMESLVTQLKNAVHQKSACDFASVIKAGREDKEVLNFVEFAKKAGDPDLYREFMQWSINNQPDLTAGFFKIHGEDGLKIAKFDELPEMAKTAADLLANAPVESQDPGQVKIVTDPGHEDASELSDEEKVNLMQTGIGIVDDRSETSTLIREEGPEKYSNANESGCYEMVTKQVDTNKVLIGVSPFSAEKPGSSYPGTVVIDPETRYMAHHFDSNPENQESRRPVVLNQEPDAEAFESFVGKCVSIPSMASGGYYVIVDTKKGRVSFPFEVGNKSGGKVSISTPSQYLWGIPNDDHQNSGFDRPLPGQGGDFEMHDRELSPGCGTWVEESDLEDARNPVAFGGRTIFPKHYKAFKLSNMDEYCCCPSVDQEDSETMRNKVDKVTPSSMSEVNIAISNSRGGSQKSGAFFDQDERSFRFLKNFPGHNFVATVSGENHPYENKTAAIRGLVEDLGLSVEDSRQLVSDAEQGKSTNCLFKKQASPASISIPWPDLNDEAGATEYSGTPQVQRVQRIQQGETGEYEHKNPHDPATSNFDDIMREMQSGEGGGEDIATIIGRAGQAGVQQVFDPAMVAIMLRTSRVQLQVESEYLPLLEKSVDRMCRTLLLFYWHNSDFANAYGQSEMAEFEDVLLTSIKSVGQITLFLRQKSVGASTSGVDAFSESF